MEIKSDLHEIKQLLKGISNGSWRIKTRKCF
jgi:hypothetical protein